MSRVQLGVLRATSQLQLVREHASLLIGAVEEPGLGLATHDIYASRRTASRWATRYATHLVVLLIVGALVALGGLRTFTVQGAYPHGLQAVETHTGTDHFEDEHTEDGKIAVDSHDFEIALPRTELGGADAAANSVIKPGAAPVQGMEIRLSIVRHTVAAGDTVESLAAKYNVMPETVMGSNGIYDPEEALAEGRTLAIPPIDGMYYVAAEGDTVQSIAHHFQVEPSKILAYPDNVAPDGTVKAGHELVVPGGMMPPREAVLSYTVKRGESLREIAARFGVDVPTMIYSNDIPDPDNLKVGSQLRVLPVSGIEYKVKPGDTILAIAGRHGVAPQMVLDYPPNKLTPESALQIDRVIMVPGGRPERVVLAEARPAPASGGEARPQSNKPESAPKPKSEQSVKPQPKAQPQPAKPQTDNAPKVATGRMIWPVRGTITQYFSRKHNGLDIAARAGTPIYAADSGRVTWSGWRTDGLGYCVIIDHGNGLTTMYGHMLRRPPVYVGQYVSRGQLIGLVGSTGRSTGPHVHFMVKVGSGRNYRNPLAYLGR